MNEMIEYIKLHKLSAEQDMEDAQNHVPINEDEYYESDMYYQAVIDTCDHLLSVATAILNK